MEHVLVTVYVLAASVFPLAMVGGAVCDLLRFQIPNGIPIALAVAFFPAALAAGWGVEAILVPVGVGAGVLAVGYLLFARGLIGAGDAKLLAAAALWVGWPGVTAYLLAVALAGGVLALVVAGFRRLSLPQTLDGVAWVRRLHREELGIPYGVAIGAGALAFYPRLPLTAWIW